MEINIASIALKYFLRLTIPFVFASFGIALIIGVILMSITTILGGKAKDESTPNLVQINTKIDGTILGGKVSKLPIFRPNNRNLFYALVTIRGAEANRPDSVYYPNDFTSCGNYQQLMGELIGNNPKASKAKEVLGNNYNIIFSNENSAKIQLYEYQGYNNIRGNLMFEPIYRGGGFVGWARTIPNDGVEICRLLVENHLATGLFDQIALTRLESMGLFNYLTSYDLNVNNTYNFALALCKSQGPVSCLDWVERSQYVLKSYLVNNTYENLTN